MWPVLRGQKKGHIQSLAFTTKIQYINMQNSRSMLKSIDYLYFQWWSKGFCINLICFFCSILYSANRFEKTQENTGHPLLHSFVHIILFSIYMYIKYSSFVSPVPFQCEIFNLSPHLGYMFYMILGSSIFCMIWTFFNTSLISVITPWCGIGPSIAYQNLLYMIVISLKHFLALHG